MERYLPVPVWNNTLGTWEPVDFRNGQKVTTWPEEFHPDQLPSPKYRDGDRVQFVRDETCARDGWVKMVMLQGGSYGPFEERDKIIEQRYCHPDAIIYIVTARNHDHQIRAWNILVSVPSSGSSKDFAHVAPERKVYTRNPKRSKCFCIRH